MRTTSVQRKGGEHVQQDFILGESYQIGGIVCNHLFRVIPLKEIAKERNLELLFAIALRETPFIGICRSQRPRLRCRNDIRLGEL